MAGNLPVPNGVEVKLVWAKAGVPFALNILHFTHAVLVTHNQTRADQIAAIYLSAVTSSGLGAGLHTSVSLLRVESRHMDQNSDPWFTGVGTPVAGTSAVDLLPPQTAFVVTARTGLRGRSFNGRVYLTGFTEGFSDAAGQASAGLRDGCVAFLTTTAASMEGVPLALVDGVLSRWTTPPTAPPNTPPTERNPPIISPITTYVANDLRWDTQRRRSIPGI